jgi:catechol 2,3-dioxygenase-like lactoylglutathione lyase family enzyme
MAIVRDHMIVPTRDKEESAWFFARIFGVPYEGAAGHFAPVRVNEQLTLDFDNWDKLEQHHYAFKVSEAEFDGIFERVREAGLRYGGRGFYFRDPDGHLLEVLTA